MIKVENVAGLDGSVNSMEGLSTSENLNYGDKKKPENSSVMGLLRVNRQRSSSTSSSTSYKAKRNSHDGEKLLEGDEHATCSDHDEH